MNEATEPSSDDRVHIHTRRLSFECYARRDGLWDIDAELIDTKGYALTMASGEDLEPGQPVHHMRLRVTVDGDLKITDIRALIDSAPFPQCQATAAPMRGLIGATLGPGWRKRIESVMGGTLGCTHLRELVFNVATAAFQSVPHYRQLHEAVPLQQPSEPPHYLGQCMSWAFDGAATKAFEPRFYKWKVLKD